MLLNNHYIKKRERKVKKRNTLRQFKMKTTLLMQQYTYQGKYSYIGLPQGQQIPIETI